MTSRMRRPLKRLLAGVGRALLPFAVTVAGPSVAAAPVPAETKPRVIVLTDIGNEPDDSESLVRFLLYTDQFDVEGLVATTSVWQRDTVRTDLIAERLAAYEAVRPNLIRHSPGYPAAAALRGVMRAGVARYGMAGVGEGQDTAASRLIVDAVDRADARPVWVLAWGGAADLAQALWSVRASRSPERVAAFIAKLRVYSISDQDDAGPWARRNFPELFWIASVHGWGQYNMATWSGISGDRRTAERWPDRETVLDPWLATNIRRGPLGNLYPLPEFIMEGDTPAFLYLISNGLGDAEHPEWGGWGGRYMRAGPDGGLHADTKDFFERDGRLWSGNQASVYRWRGAFQNDFAARIGWSVAPRYKGANHPPAVVAQGVEGTGAVRLSARSGETVALDAAGTRDPDGDALSYRWWQYREVGGIPPQPAVTIATPDAARTAITLPTVMKAVSLHLILEVKDAGAPSLTRYRRIIIDVQP